MGEHKVSLALSTSVGVGLDQGVFEHYFLFGGIEFSLIVRFRPNGAWK